MPAAMDPSMYHVLRVLVIPPAPQPTAWHNDITLVVAPYDYFSLPRPIYPHIVQTDDNVMVPYPLGIMNTACSVSLYRPIGADPAENPAFAEWLLSGSNSLPHGT